MNEKEELDISTKGQACKDHEEPTRKDDPVEQAHQGHHPEEVLEEEVHKMHRQRRNHLEAESKDSSLRNQERNRMSPLQINKARLEDVVTHADAYGDGDHIVADRINVVSHLPMMIHMEAVEVVGHIKGIVVVDLIEVDLDHH